MAELLSPVQDLVSLKAAIDAKADSVYFGIDELNMRMGAKNFKLSEIKKIADICHKNKVKAYLTLNTIVYDNEIDKVKKILKKAKQAKIDAIIAWDFSVINEANKINLPIHISTQASIANFDAIKAIKKQYKNIESVNLARELSLDDIRNIIKKIKKDKLKINIETFVHGAMCVSVSGRCFLSQEIFGKSANRGECLQPCRRKYILKDVEEDHEIELGEEYAISPKDMCTLPFLDKLIDAGISAFKIEGRNKSPEYVRVVTEVYREAIDNPKSDKKKLLGLLKTVYNRGFSSGFYLGKPIDEWAKCEGSKAIKKKSALGFVKNYYPKVGVAEIVLEANDLKLSDTIMFQGPTTGVFEQEVDSMQISHKDVSFVKKGRSAGIKTIRKVRENDKVYLVL
jgi:putative protease